ncbi:DNA-binding barrel domain superfamily [Sesbania bispinosa]|nr:DNA-binding barrel domain superfamily [Sesbania bispinosa]
MCRCNKGSDSSTRKQSCIIPTKKKPQETRWGYTTDLMLYDDPWKIKKVLKESDVGNLSRLLLHKELVEKFVLPMLGPNAQREAETEKGTKIIIWDVDTQSMHHLVFK